MPPSSPPLRLSLRAFTLIELLVVVAIIAVLAALLIPAINTMRQRAVTIKCASNMSQVGAAMLAYAGDNNGTLPAPENPDTGQVWFEAILPYLIPTAFDSTSPNSLICPVWREIWKKPPYNGAASDPRRAGMGMSLVMVGSPTTGWPGGGEPSTTAFTRPVQIQNHSQTIMVAEDNNWNWGIHAQNYMTESYFQPASGQERGNRHGKGANFLFVDGHVQQLNQENILPFLAK